VCSSDLISPAGNLSLQDHATYTQVLIDKISNLAQKAGANRLITTEKDYVKLQQMSFEFPLDVVAIESIFPKELHEFIGSNIANYSKETTNRNMSS
jgi:tetraacyldisaccharide-1-P 4'-kinase